MKYYAHFGHKEFILCLGHGRPRSRSTSSTTTSAPRTTSCCRTAAANVELLQHRHRTTGRITFVDTGLTSNIGERLRRVRPHLDDDEMFLANYADGLSDLDLDSYVKSFVERDKTACFLSVPAPHTFHIVHADADDHASRSSSTSVARLCASMPGSSCCATRSST